MFAGMKKAGNMRNFTAFKKADQKSSVKEIPCPCDGGFLNYRCIAADTLV